MKYLFFISLLCLNCSDIRQKNPNQLEFDSCYNPEIEVLMEEQFFYDLNFGELELDLINPISIDNLGYSIQKGRSCVFVYRHFESKSYNMINDEVEVRILFQVENSIDYFSLSTTQDFQDSNFIYAECGVASNQVIGKMTGKKISEQSWKIDAALKIQKSNSIKEVFINGEFQI